MFRVVDPSNSLRTISPPPPRAGRILRSRRRAVYSGRPGSARSRSVREPFDLRPPRPIWPSRRPSGYQPRSCSQLCRWARPRMVMCSSRWEMPVIPALVDRTHPRDQFGGDVGIPFWAPSAGASRCSTFSTATCRARSPARTEATSREPPGCVSYFSIRLQWPTLRSPWILSETAPDPRITDGGPETGRDSGKISPITRPAPGTHKDKRLFIYKLRDHWHWHGTCLGDSGPQSRIGRPGRPAQRGGIMKAMARTAGTVLLMVVFSLALAMAGCRPGRNKGHRGVDRLKMNLKVIRPQEDVLTVRLLGRPMVEIETTPS